MRPLTTMEQLVLKALPSDRTARWFEELQAATCLGERQLAAIVAQLHRDDLLEAIGRNRNDRDAPPTGAKITSRGQYVLRQRPQAPARRQG